MQKIMFSDKFGFTNSWTADIIAYSYGNIR